MATATGVQRQRWATAAARDCGAHDAAPNCCPASNRESGRQFSPTLRLLHSIIMHAYQGELLLALNLEMRRSSSRHTPLLQVLVGLRPGTAASNASTPAVSLPAMGKLWP